MNFKKGEVMKVYVYDKKTNKSVAIITDVILVREFANSIEIIDTIGRDFVYDKREVKTCIYQN